MSVNAQSDNELLKDTRSRVSFFIFELMTCARCQNTFQCKADDIQNCDCTRVQLMSATLEYLSATNYSCLCNSCLTELNSKIADISNEKNFSNKDLKEGRDYYMENGYLVFSELYHMRRGYCCKNACRHCAYGYHLDNKKDECDSKK